MYAKFFKRFFDFLLALAALIILLPLMLLLTIIGTFAMGGNPFFVQKRPGRNERVFSLIKFRTMTNKKDASGKLLPDDERLCAYGRFLRSTSCDELPSLLNILVGDMAIVGPRPLLVRDMVFMTSEQRRRHSVRPGLTGLAQCNGRNGISWEKKLEYDCIYIDSGITLSGDLRIILKTVVSVFRREGINEEGRATAADLGDYLLEKGEVSSEDYAEKQEEAKKILALR